MSWTTTMVEAWLIEAADTLRRLPSQGPRGFRSSMPTPVRSLAEAAEEAPGIYRRPPPSAAAIDRLDRVLGWMRWLDEDQVRLVWGRAMGIRWKPLCERLGCGRTSAWQKWVTALVLLKARLNEAGEAAPEIAPGQKKIA